MGQDEIRVYFEYSPKPLHALVILTGKTKSFGQIGTDYEGKWIQFLSLAELGDRLIKPAHSSQVAIAVPVMGNRVIRIQLDRTLVVFFRLLPIPVVLQRNHGQRSVSVSELFIHRERLKRCGLGIWHGDLLRLNAIAPEQNIGVSQTCISLSKGRVLRNRRFEILDRFTDSGFRPFVPEEASPEICLIGLRIYGSTASKIGMLGGGQF